MSWYEIYLEEIKLKKNIKNYIDYKIKHKKKLIKLIEKYSPNKKIMEAGCGTGIISTYMCSKGYDVTEVDINNDILNLAKKVSNEYIKEGNPKFVLKSIYDLNFKNNEFDVSFSNGVLEHFSDEKIIETLKLQLMQSSYVIVGIPTKFFNDNEALYGDERFLELTYWRKLFAKADANIVEETSYHYMTLIEKMTSLNKMFRPKPFRVFVLKKKN